MLPKSCDFSYSGRAFTSWDRVQLAAIRHIHVSIDALICKYCVTELVPTMATMPLTNCEIEAHALQLCSVQSEIILVVNVRHIPPKWHIPHGAGPVGVTRHHKSLRDIEVPMQKFIVDELVFPHDLAWPQNLWSMQPGATLKRVRHGRAYCQHKAELERLGIEFTVNKKKRPRPDAGQGGDNGATAAGSLKVKLHRPSTDASLKVKLRRPVTPTSQ